MLALDMMLKIFDGRPGSTARALTVATGDDGAFDNGFCCTAQQEFFEFGWFSSPAGGTRFAAQTAQVAGFNCADERSSERLRHIQLLVDPTRGVGSGGGGAPIR
jgi:hypothetical protein